MEMLLIAVVALAVAAAIVWGVWRGLTAPPGPPTRRPWDEEGRAGRTLVLDVGAADPDDPAVQRLVREAAHHALRADPTIDDVEVRARDGAVLGHVSRTERTRGIDIPEELHEPHARTDHGPRAVPGDRPRHPTISRDELGDERLPHHRDVADRFELPEQVEDELTDRDDPIELVRAILAVAGREPVVDGDRIVADGVAIVIVAYLRCQAAGVRRGVVIRLGWVNAEALRRREAAAPWIRHVDADAIQRMADAVAIGADPVAFAVGPRVVG